MLLKELQVSGDQLEISGPEGQGTQGPFLYRYLEYCIQERTLGPFSPFGLISLRVSGYSYIMHKKGHWVPCSSGYLIFLGIL
jgi:hypothetical protein